MPASKIPKILSKKEQTIWRDLVKEWGEQNGIDRALMVDWVRAEAEIRAARVNMLEALELRDKDFVAAAQKMLDSARDHQRKIVALVRGPDKYRSKKQTAAETAKHTANELGNLIKFPQ